ncbi:uncharacterized protein LOC117241127 [Bombus vosnesenskii]|uniref:Uncharacterized protein LOC117241127 n=1 Tax=Bombus vosnesenskii TaxID=207650 RepID=A0A6J3LBJ7_9HYME|nr:uncharacterized protein LOC117241127 [Bombus vosnesenskii]
MEVAEESQRRMTRGSRKTADRSESVLFAPAMVADAMSSMAGGLWARTKSDDEESVASFAPRSSVTSTASRGKKRRIIITAPDVSKELAFQTRTSSAADVSAGLTMHVSEIMRVATSSSNLKGAYIKALKDAASYLTAAWKNESPRRTGPARGSETGATRLVEATRLSALEEENAALRQELSRRAACAHECPRCSGPASESGRPPREGKSDRVRIEALERIVKEMGSSIIRTIEERFAGRRQRIPEAGRCTGRSATRRVIQTASLPREQEGGDWRVAEAKKKRMKKKQKMTAAAGGETARKGATVAPPMRGGQQQPQSRATGAPTQRRRNEQRTVAGTQDGHAPSRTVNIRGDSNAERGSKDIVRRRARGSQSEGPLSELGVEIVEIKKAMTGAIIIRVPGDRDWGKAELRVTGIDISVKKEELRQALASAAECGCAEVHVGEIGAARGGLGSAWIMCPVAGVRKLAQAGKIALGWTTARIRPILERPLQCFRCLELEHVRATCVSSEDRGHLCYRCGGSGHRARGCPASAPKCPLCESLGAPAKHRMIGAACPRPPESQEEETHPRANCGKDPREYRQSSSGRSSGEGHGGDRVVQAPPSMHSRQVEKGARSALLDHPGERGRPCGDGQPYRVPDAPNWVGDLDGTAAITWTPALGAAGVLLDRGSGFVAVEWAGVAVVAVYVSPNIGLAEFEDFLDRVDECVGRCLPRQVLVLGDFDTHSTQWGNPRTNSRGRILTDWAAGLVLLLANRGSASTCVAWRGSSVVDVRWTTPELFRRIHDWRVAAGVETLSDHLYILIEMAPEVTQADKARRVGGRSPKIHERGVRRLDAALRSGW